MSRGQDQRANWTRLATNDAANLIALPWWAWCLVPPSHAVFTTSPNYDAMRGMAGQSTWGTVVLVLWLTHLISLHSGHMPLRIAVLLSCAMFWALVATMLLIANYAAPGVGPYAAFSLLSGYRASRLMGQARHV